MTGLDVGSGVSVQRRRTTRATTVAAAALVGVGAWVVAVPILGLALRVKTAGHPLMTVGLPQVVLTALVMALSGWAMLAILERATSRAGTIWTAVATAVLVLSYAAPLTAGDAPAATTVLVLMHTVVGLTLIGGLRRTVETPRPAPASAQTQRTVAADPERAHTP